MQDILADSHTPCERRSNSPLEGPFIPSGAEVKLCPIYLQKTKVECISSAHKCLSSQIQGIRLERGGKLDWWFIDRGYGRSQNKATIWISRKKQIKRCGHFSKRNNEFVSMQDGRNIARMTAVILPLPTSGKNSSNKIFSRRRSPRSQTRSWSSTRFLKYSGRLHMLESSCSDDEAQEFRRTIFRYLWITFLRTIVRCLIYLDVQRQTKTSFDVFKRRPSMITGTWMETSHCLNRGSVWHDSRCSTKIYQKDICVFKADWRRNKSQQDEEPFGQKNRQTCRKAHSVQP